MKKPIAVATVLILGLTVAFTGSVMAQKKQAPKGVWKAMVASLTDIQVITGALAVFDMERAAKFADELVKRETYISGIERLPQEVRDGHAKVADAAKELADALKAGDDQDASAKLGGVLAACSACHYDVRDAKRRKKME